jgi:hypothetical protein
MKLALYGGFLMHSVKLTPIKKYFDEASCMVLGAAKAELFRRNQHEIDIGHLLYGVLAYEEEQDPGRATEVNLSILEILGRHLGLGPDNVSLDCPNSVSPRASRAIRRALQLSGLQQITYHCFLLGMAGSSENLVDQVFCELNPSIGTSRYNAAIIDGSICQRLIPAECDAVGEVDLDVTEIPIPRRFTTPGTAWSP